jgi:predicted ArsR family transcriptional regulator
MARGRPESIGDDRLLIELLIHTDRAVFTSELADELDVTNQTIRERMESLSDAEKVIIDEVGSGNLYRLSEDGNAYLRELLRSEFE